MIGNFALAAAIFAAAPLSPISAMSDEEAQRIVDRDFRLYRIQVYHSFRLVRPEFDRRRQAGDAALEAWKKAGGQGHQAQPLVEWFRAARAASQPQMLAALPPLPAIPAAVATVPPAVPLAIDAPRSPATSAAHWPVRRAEARSGGRAAASPPRPPAKPAWQSVSRALLKGVVFGAVRTLPQP